MSISSYRGKISENRPGWNAPSGGRQIVTIKPGIYIFSDSTDGRVSLVYNGTLVWTKQEWVEKIGDDPNNPPAPIITYAIRPYPRLWRVNHDKTSWRPNLPEVFRLDPDHNVVLTEPIQRLWRAMNPQLSNEQWRRCLGNGLAFTNNHGFPGCADYINGLDLDKEDPCFDQMRVCGGAFLTGIPSNGVLRIEAIDVRKPLPTAEYVTQRTWLWFEAVNVDWSVEQKSIVIRRFKGDWNLPVYVPVLVSVDATYPLDLLTEVSLQSPYEYP